MKRHAFFAMVFLTLVLCASAAVGKKAARAAALPLPERQRAVWALPPGRAPSDVPGEAASPLPGQRPVGARQLRCPARPLERAECSRGGIPLCGRAFYHAAWFAFSLGEASG